MRNLTTLYLDQN